MEFDANLTKSLVEPLILHLVSHQPRYGYEIINMVSELSEKAFEWREGFLYPCLRRMENQGLVESEWQTSDSGRRRKYYKITEKGVEVLQQKLDEWQAFSRAANAVLEG